MQTTDQASRSRMGRYAAAPHFVAWTTPGEVVSGLSRRWARGELLRALLNAEALFPMTAKLRYPDATAFRDRLDEVQRWLRDLEQGSREYRGSGYELHWTEIVSRHADKPIRVPTSLVIPTMADALYLIDKATHAERFEALASRTLKMCPDLHSWLAKHPLRVVKQAEDWDRFLTLVAWFQAHPQPRVYLRQLELPDIDPIFIRQNQSLLSELLTEVLPREAVDRHSRGAQRFEGRFGLLTAPTLVRIRFLGPGQSLAGFTEVSVPVAQLARSPLSCTNVYVTDNDINALAFPAREDSVVLFGMSHADEWLAGVEWLRDRTVYYWGDIDAGGFASLDRLRATLPGTRSFLMDRETMLEHRHAWSPGSYKHQSTATFGRLTSDERSLLSDLIDARFGAPVRLAQERVSYRWLLSRLERPSDCPEGR
jgi:hypothetical protein